MQNNSENDNYSPHLQNTDGNYSPYLQNVDSNYSPYNQNDYIPQEYRNEKNPVLAAFLSFLIMLAFLGIQVVGSLPFMVGSTIKVASEIKYNSDMSADEITKTLVDNLDTVGITLFATVISAIVAILWYKFGYCKGVKPVHIKKTLNSVLSEGKLFGIIFAAIALFYLSNILILLIDLISPETISKYNEMMDMAGISVVNWKVILTTVILAPINEECIMRGIIFRKLKKHMVPIAAIIISAVYFGIFHMNLVQGIYATALGLFMAYLANKYDSIIPSFIFHAVFNGLNFILIFLPDVLNDSIVFNLAVPAVFMTLWYFFEYKRKIV